VDQTVLDCILQLAHIDVPKPLVQQIKVLICLIDYYVLLKLLARLAARIPGRPGEIRAVNLSHKLLAKLAARTPGRPGKVHAVNLGHWVLGKLTLKFAKIGRNAGAVEHVHSPDHSTFSDNFES
jgi:hypothetical protein